MIVDFHCHSTASDGTTPPAQLAEMARAGGFTALALTDHDNCDGVAELLSADGDACRLLAGVELSIEPGAGFDKFHLLGLGIDAENPELKAFLRRILEGRNARNEQIIANFRKLGYEMTGTIEAYAHGEVLARPHFARWLMDRGHARNMKEAFDLFLLPDSPRATRCYEPRFHPPQEEAFQVIHRAGGLAVMAHPKYWRRHWRVVGPEYTDAARELARLHEKGLDGVEALYQANTTEETIEFSRICTRLGLLISAGSDYHGANKPTISLGMNVASNLLAPLLEMLKCDIISL